LLKNILSKAGLPFTDLASWDAEKAYKILIHEKRLLKDKFLLVKKIAKRDILEKRGDLSASRFIECKKQNFSN
jgi:hypothetical protein